LHVVSPSESVESENSNNIRYDYLLLLLLQNDFILGVALGNIQNAFLTSFVSTQARYPNPQELIEISNVIFKRIQEIGDAIFSAG
jgi:hypothetical protein